jgi:fatty-acyl-CoA synthase
MPGGLYEKIEGLQREVPSLKRIVIVPLDGTISFDGELLKPDPAWRSDYGKSTDTSHADRVGVMLPTGGTTGHPKVARLTHRAMVASCVSSRMALDYRRGDRGMISLPLFHVGGLFVGVGACMSVGCTIVIPGPAGARDPALITNFWTIIEKYRLTHAGNVPTTLGALADIPVGGADISSLRVTPTGASICPPEIERRYLATWGGPCVQQVYGMTELAGAITHDVAGVKPRPESVGTKTRWSSSPSSQATACIRGRGPRRSANCSRAARRCFPAMSTRSRPKRPLIRDGCAPATSAASTPTALSTSWAAPKT